MAREKKVLASDEEPSQERTWRDGMRLFADTAIVGMVLGMASVLVIPFGAGIATASAAVYEGMTVGHMTTFTDARKRFVRGLVPGLGATLIAVVGVLLIIFNASTVAAGKVPGGKGMLAGTVLVGVLLAGLAGLTIVEIGRTGGAGWRRAARAAGQTALVRPIAPLAIGGVMALSILLILILPPTLPIMIGVMLYAIHAVGIRLAPVAA
jgi:hypothetical protein